MSTPVANRVIRIISRAAMVPEGEIRPAMSLSALDMGSLEQIECMLAIEEAFRVELDQTALWQASTVQDVIDAVTRAVAAASGRRRVQRAVHHPSHERSSGAGPPILEEVVMPIVSESTDIAAPVEEVFTYIADHPERATIFIPGLNRISNVSPPEAGVGQAWEYEFNWFGLVIAGNSRCTRHESLPCISSRL